MNTGEFSLRPVLLNKRIVGSKWDFTLSASVKNSYILQVVEENARTPGDITFPCSNLTFLCADPLQGVCSPEFLEPLRHRILACKVNHTSVHALVWVANNDASRFYQLQSALAAFPADCGIQIHPVHSCDEVIHTVTRLSLFLDTEHEDIVQGKIAQAMEELPEMDMASQDIWLPLIAGMSGTANNLSHHDCFVIQEGAQSLARIASASVAELRDFSLDKSTAMAVRAFFEEETVI